MSQRLEELLEDLLDQWLWVAVAAAIGVLLLGLAHIITAVFSL